MFSNSGCKRLLKIYVRKTMMENGVATYYPRAYEWNIFI
jgi:hypothetical protein